MGKLYLIGMGPGRPDCMTPEAGAALERCEILCGYTVYLELVRDRFPDKEMFSTPMTREIERCKWAVERAAEGRQVAMLCSGDAGVYGMAGPVLELAEGRNLEIEVVPGVTAAVSGAAVLGAPLMNDFCVVSLSDLLTGWDVIENRLRAASAGDFVLVLYNPRSGKRPNHLRRACDILMESKPPDTVCGWVRNIGREGQESRVLSLLELRDENLDMFCTAFVGNSSTETVDGRMVTHRGYRREK